MKLEDMESIALRARLEDGERRGLNQAYGSGRKGRKDTVTVNFTNLSQ